VLQLAAVFHSPPLAGPIHTSFVVICACAVVQPAIENAAKSHAVLKIFVVCITMMWWVLFRLNYMARILFKLTHSSKKIHQMFIRGKTG
jgi:hypothetical protein